MGSEMCIRDSVKVLRRVWSGPFDAKDGLTIEQIEQMAQSAELDTYLRPLAEGLSELPEVKTTDQGNVRLLNGNPGMVIANDVEFGEEAWASYQGKPVAVGRYKAGELHPSRVFNL